MSKLTKFKALGFSGQVDKENRILKEVVMIEPNREALGHGLFVDDFMVNQVVEFGNSSAVGFKARMDHPNACTSAMGSQLGRLKNFKMKGGKAVADMHIAEFTKDAPGGDIGKWLLSVAAEDPDQLGFSIVFSQAEPVMLEAGEGDDIDSPEFAYPHARIDTFYGADVVDEGAATSSLFEDGIQGRPDYLAEQAVLFVSEKEDLFRTALEPLVKKMVTELNDNTNPKSIKMNDNKLSFTDEIKDVFKKHFSSEEVVVESPEVEEVTEEVESTEEEVEETIDNSEVEALAAIEEVKTALSAHEELLRVALSENEELKAANAEFESKIADLEKVSLGETVEPVATTDDSVELSAEAKADRIVEEKENDVLRWASSQANGESIVDAYLKNQKNK